VFQAIGLKGPKGLDIPGFEVTSGNSRFNVKKRKWVTNLNTMYIKNEDTYRATEPVKGHRLRLSNVLYSFNPTRNSWMPRNLIHKSAMIPFVGLKNTSFILKEK
jgi:hypothetical protein